MAFPHPFRVHCILPALPGMISPANIRKPSGLLRRSITSGKSRGLLSIEEANLPRGKVVHTADQGNFVLVEHFAENGAAFTDLFHH